MLKTSLVLRTFFHLLKKQAVPDHGDRFEKTVVYAHGFHALYAFHCTQIIVSQHNSILNVYILA